MKFFDKKIFGSWAAKTAVVTLCLMLALCSIAILPHRTSAQSGPFYPGSQASVFPNYKYPAMVFTATSQTVKQTLSGVSTATIQIYGVATAATLQIKASNDGGTNYFAIPYFAGVYTSNVPVIVTGAAFPAYTGTPVLYWVNLSGFTNVEIISSGTFTGASASVQITASSNKGII